jgi:hypothetical protein
MGTRAIRTRHNYNRFLGSIETDSPGLVGHRRLMPPHENGLFLASDGVARRKEANSLRAKQLINCRRRIQKNLPQIPREPISRCPTNLGSTRNIEIQLLTGTKPNSQPRAPVRKSNTPRGPLLALPLPVSCGRISERDGPRCGGARRRNTRPYFRDSQRRRRIRPAGKADTRDWEQ